MAKEEFGKSWWGAHWLAAIAKIDSENRLARGKAYARNGSVLSVEVKGGQINAIVEGKRPTPHKVQLTMATFEQEKVHRLVELISTYPTIMSKLQNGKLDPLLLELCERSDIHLFPMHTGDIKMKCSCPDLVSPCKHIASVIYKMSSDIDNNPFLLFEFRNIDLKNLLRSRLDSSGLWQAQHITDYAEFIDSHKVVMHDKLGHGLGQINFSTLRNRHHELMQLLENEPPFYTLGNFKNIYNQSLLRVQKVAGRILLSNEDLVLYTKEKSKSQQDYDVIPQLIWDGQNVWSEGLTMAQILIMDDEQLSYYHPATADIQMMLQLTFYCLALGLVMPKLVTLNQKYYIVWQPAVIDPILNKILEHKETPYGIVIGDDGQRGDLFLSLTLLLTHFTHIISHIEKKATEIVDAVFFERYGYKFNDLSESSVPMSIRNWISLYEWDLGEFIPVLEINEHSEDSFSIDIMIRHKGEHGTLPQPFASFIQSLNDQHALHQFYADLDLLSIYINGVSEYINDGGNHPIMMDNVTFVEFLFSIRPVMYLLGIEIALPSSMKKIIRPKASVSIYSREGQSSTGILGLSKLLDFDWKVSLGEQLVSVQEFQSLVQVAGKLIKYKDQYIYISPQDLAALHKQLLKKDNLSAIDLLHTAIGEEYDGAVVQLTEDVKSMITSLSKVETLPIPSLINAQMRPYQVRGFSWLVKNAQIGIGSILADDMGLGKTLQVIALIGYLIEHQLMQDKKALIIVPTSLLPNWESEFQKFAPQIKFAIHYGQERALARDGVDVVLTSYGVLRSDLTLFSNKTWSVLVVDEAQNIKNPSSLQTKAVKTIKADHYIAMSGTPVENRLLDYWCIMDFVNKGLLGTRPTFFKIFDKPIAKDRDQAALGRFRKITKPFIMRRMKTDHTIIADLPDKIVQDTFATLTVEQAALYEKVLQEGLATIENQHKDDSKYAFKRQGLILQMILSLKQICNHPAHWLKNQSLETHLSGKSALLMSLIGSIIEGGDKMIIFTQFKEMGDIMSEQIYHTFGFHPLWLHGGVPMLQRKTMVDDFQTLSNKKVMILSLKAGGTGLNLTAANHVIHYDLWWNPAVEMQATDRAFRIGQLRNVMVHRLITKNTFEEKINDLINSKKDLASLTVSTGERWIGELSDREIKQLFSLKTASATMAG